MTLRAIIVGMLALGLLGACDTETTMEDLGRYGFAAKKTGCEADADNCTFSSKPTKNDGTCEAGYSRLPIAMPLGDGETLYRCYRCQKTGLTSCSAKSGSNIPLNGFCGLYGQSKIFPEQNENWPDGRIQFFYNCQCSPTL